MVITTMQPGVAARACAALTWARVSWWARRSTRLALTSVTVLGA
jgi:hypothetical protein